VHKHIANERFSNEQGATMIEASLVLPFVLFFIFVSIDLFIFAYQAVAVQFVATQVMREISTSERVTTGNAYIEVIDAAEAFLLDFKQPGARVCLCPIEDTGTIPGISNAGQCLNSQDRCREFPLSGTPQNSLPAGTSFMMAIRYPVPQLFALLMKQNFRVEAISIGRAEPEAI